MPHAWMNEKPTSILQYDQDSKTPPGLLRHEYLPERQRFIGKSGLHSRCLVPDAELQGHVRPDEIVVAASMSGWGAQLHCVHQAESSAWPRLDGKLPTLDDRRTVALFQVGKNWGQVKKAGRRRVIPNRRVNPSIADYPLTDPAS